MKIELPFQYDFDSVLTRLALDPLHAVDFEKKTVRVPLDQGNIISVEGVGTTEDPAFILNNIQDEQQLMHIQSTFHFDRPLTTIHEHFQKTNLHELFQNHRGTPIVREFSLYGTLMKSIIHQQLNLSFAHTLTERFVHSFGEEKDGVWFYPTPEKIASLSVETLRALQFSTRKSEYVIEVSKKIVQGELNLENIHVFPDEEIINNLVKIRGIGPWTAQNFLLFGLGRPNLFPIADIGLQRALQKLWGLQEKPTKEEITYHLPDWSPYLSYAALYLWRSVE